MTTPPSQASQAPQASPAFQAYQAVQAAQATQATQANPVLDFSMNLRDRMWRTAGARFNAYRRMKRCNNLSAFTIAMLSIYAVTISVCQIRYDLGTENPILDKNLTIISVVGSLFIVAVSLIEWAKDFSIKADRLLDNATQITNLRTELQFFLATNQNGSLTQGVDNIRKAYDRLTDGDSPNHEPLDDLMFRAQNYSDPNPKFEMHGFQAFLVRSWCHLLAYWFYISAILIPPVVVIYSILAFQTAAS